MRHFGSMALYSLAPLHSPEGRYKIEFGPSEPMNDSRCHSRRRGTAITVDQFWWRPLDRSLLDLQASPLPGSRSLPAPSITSTALQYRAQPMGTASSHTRSFHDD